MVCKTYELKIDKSHLTRVTLETLRMLFLEAKWFYNDLVASGDVFHADYKRKAVQVKGMDGGLEIRMLRSLSAQMRQEIVDRAKESVKSLSQHKRNGHRIGALKFKSRILSIPLRQYGKTHRIDANRVKIQNIGQHMRVRGLDQIPVGVEVANATLEQRSGDYFIHLTTYREPVECSLPWKAIGVDAGVKHQLTLSNGVQIDECVPVTKKIRRLRRELSRRKLHSRNWFKTNSRLNRANNNLTNQRKDIGHKIVSKLVSTYDSVAIQDDRVAGWKRIWGRRVTASSIGGIMSDLKNKARTPVVVKRLVPTTRRCSNCGSLRNILLEERIYRCDRCRLLIDRDLNAAINNWNAIPAERRESTPVDTRAATELMGYFNSIPHVSASLVEETGSRLLATETAVSPMVAHPQYFFPSSALTP